MRKRLTVIAIFAACAAIPVEPAGAHTSCGTINIKRGREFGTFHVLIERGHASCAEVRRTATNFMAGGGTEHGGPGLENTYWTLPGGWHCELATGGGGGCFRGGQWQVYGKAHDAIGFH
jgi:hypothetical protein